MWRCSSISGGSGSSTIDGGAGSNLIAIVDGRAGGTMLLNGFDTNPENKVQLQGYAPGELANDIAAAGSSNTIVLSDNTRITFGGLSSVSVSKFV